MNTLLWQSICPTGEALHIASVKNNERRKPDLHCQDFYECFLVESGLGVHWTPGGEDPLRSGDFIFIRPEQGHGFSGSPSHPLIFTNIAFEASIIEQLIPYCHPLKYLWRPKSGPGSIQISSRQREELISLILEVAHSPRQPSDAVYCLSGLARIVRPSFKQHHLDILPVWLRDALGLAKDPEVLAQGTSKLVQLCGRSPEHVSRSFRKYLDLRPSEWITRERIRYACRLLETTQQSVLEIALECGFESHSYFHAQFKKQVGQTPLQYKRRIARIQN